MKTSSKLYFALGALATLGTLTIVYCAIQDTDKSPKELFNDSKKFIKRSVKRGDNLIDEAVGAMEKESNSIVRESKSMAKDASNVL